MRRKAVSIRTLMSVSMAIMISLFVLIAGTLLNIFASNAIEDNTMDSASEIVTQVNNNLSTYINDIIDVSDYIRELSRTTSNLDRAAIQTRLEALISSRDDLVSISVFDLDGKPIISTEPRIETTPEEISEEKWFRRAADGEGDFFFTGPHRNSIGQGDFVISYSTIISYGDINRKASSAVLLIDLNFNAVEELSESAHLSQTGYIYIISNDGDIVYHPMERLIDEGVLDEDLRSVSEHVFGSYISEFEGRERLTIIQTVEQTRWRIVGIAFMDELLEPLKPFRITLISLMIIFILIAILLSRTIAMHITKPLRALELSMRDVQKGNFNVKAPEGESKEVESLSHSFQVMVKRIEDLMIEVRKTEEVKRQRELDALQAKINPHFLYNTLDSVVWMAETGNNQGVVKMVTALASLFRISIAKGHDTITLKEELAHVESYLNIQSMRYKDKFRFEIILPQELENAPTIKLIVQPIVENSIYHGIKYLQEEGLIRIEAKDTGDGKIWIIVSDNGVGMAPDMLSTLLDKESERNHSKEGNGIGLINIDERIKLSYGDEYGLSIESELDEGTTVTITIPHLEPIEPIIVKHSWKSDQNDDLGSIYY